MNANPLLTLEEAARQIRMIPVRLRRLADTSDIPHVRLPDGEIRFDSNDLNGWIESHKLGLENRTN